jgi:hypothetical protein
VGFCWHLDMETISSVASYFSRELESLNCDDLTKAYIVSILSKFKSSIDDLSNESITIRYSKAKFNHDFHGFQTIGDYLFFCNALFPEHLNGASIEYYSSLAQSSYYHCFLIMNKSFRIYERLADEFVPLSNSTRKIIQQR